jgi:RNA polymerase sigma factor (sigma-70 family)
MTTTIKQYDSLDTYINLAKKTISKFCPKFYNGLAAEMLRNPDAVSDVATAIMYADWRFDPDRKGKTGLQKTIYSYRNQCAIWAIKTYVTSKYKKQKDVSLDFDNDHDSESLNSMIEDKKALTPIANLIEKESSEQLSNTLNELLDNNLLTEKQKEQIKLYYFDDETLFAIGKRFGVSREAVRQNIKRGIEIIRSHDKCQS